MFYVLTTKQCHITFLFQVTYTSKRTEMLLWSCNCSISWSVLMSQFKKILYLITLSPAAHHDWGTEVSACSNVQVEIITATKSTSFSTHTPPSSSCSRDVHEFVLVCWWPMILLYEKELHKREGRKYNCLKKKKKVESKIRLTVSISSHFISGISPSSLLL